MNKQSIEHKKTLTSFKKASSLLKKVIKMTEEGTYCIDVMQQNMAVIGLLKSAHQMLMENHLKTCFAQAVKKDNESLKEKMTQEILNVTKLYNK